MTNSAADAGSPVWTPNVGEVALSQIQRFGDQVDAQYHVQLTNYNELWQWSVNNIEAFWSAIWEFFDVQSNTGYRNVLRGSNMIDTVWFQGADVNYAEHALRFSDGEDIALCAISEDGSCENTSWKDLRVEVGSLARWFREQGVERGDRVVGYLPTGRHAVVAFLASASVGAVWSACGQDLAARGAAARFAQLDPKVLIVADGYSWNGVRHDRRDQARELVERLPSIQASVAVSHIGLSWTDANLVSWEQATAIPALVHFESVEFSHPLWVLFSSGTTGPPKGIVHGHGGVLLEHLKMLGLHLNLQGHDRFFWYTTTNWMMWNVVVSGLLIGATIFFYDGSPTYPTAQKLFELADQHNIKVLGVSPGYLLTCEKSAAGAIRDLKLDSLRILASTGSPLPAATYSWVEECVGSHVQLNSTSGGTDVVSAFAGSAPTSPVWAGELSAALLGVALDAWDEKGRPLVDEVGELVVTKPMPSMPIYFWSDPGRSRYRETYFSTYPGVWRHGDWITHTSRGTFIFSGRSDSTLNRHGVRIGSADIYDVVERLPGVREALVIGAEISDGSYWMPLFVVPEKGVDFDENLRGEIRAALRNDASPRHVPDEIIEVPAIPHTRTGKKLEIPVKRIIQGAPVNDISNRDAVDDFEVLVYFTRFSRA